MVISFSSFQCKRAHPTEIEDVIKIRERRDRRGRVMTEPLKGYSVWSEPLGDISYVPWDGSVVAPAEQIHIDPLTHKQFKVPQPNEKDIGDMFKFYGIDAEIYECPVCDLKGSLRTLLPHLNNTESGFIGTVYATPKPTPEDCDCEVDRPASGEITIPSGDSFIGEIHESHGWTFKQLGEWLETLGH